MSAHEGHNRSSSLPSYDGGNRSLLFYTWLFGRCGDLYHLDCLLDPNTVKDYEVRGREELGIA